jgi:hypothetical protein
MARATYMVARGGIELQGGIDNTLFAARKWRPIPISGVNLSSWRGRATALSFVLPHTKPGNLAYARLCLLSRLSGYARMQFSFLPISLGTGSFASLGAAKIESARERAGPGTIS